MKKLKNTYFQNSIRVVNADILDVFLSLHVAQDKIETASFIKYTCRKIFFRMKILGSTLFTNSNEEYL